MANYDTAEFWEMVIQDVSALIANIEGLSTLSELANQLGSIDISQLANDEELLDTLQVLLTDNGPDALLEK